jgi:hypothetical protein
MPSTLRAAFVAALAIACSCAAAQTPVPPEVTVQRIAPQLVAFAGSQSNFQNLVSGLAQGTQVQLVSVLPDGSAQIVTFTPAAAVPPERIAPALETARQQLIGLGIAAPSAEQLAFALTGGAVPTALGAARVAGSLNPPLSANPQTAPSPAAQIQATVQNIPAANTTASTGGGIASTALAAPRFNTSDSRIPAGATSFSPTLPTPPVTAAGAAATPSPLLMHAPLNAPSTNRPLDR